MLTSDERAHHALQVSKGDQQHSSASHDTLGHLRAASLRHSYYLQADRTVRPVDCEGELHGKALFTSPVLNQVPAVRRLETVDESLPSTGQPGYDDLNGKSPTAAL